MKRFISLVLAVLMIAATAAIVPAPVSADTAWTRGGSGTESDPYTIASATDLAVFMRNTQTSNYMGKFFRLDADVAYNTNYVFGFDEASGLETVTDVSTSQIVLCIGTGHPGTTYHVGYVSKTQWDDISTAGTYYDVSSLTGALAAFGGTMPKNLTQWQYFAKTNVFKGTFDGNGHTISGLFYNGTSANIGFFSAAASCTIKNLKLTNGYMCSTPTSYSGVIAGIAGALSGTTRISNCVNENTICSTKADVGGIAATGASDANITIEGCVNRGVVAGASDTNGVTNVRLGGIIGWIRGAKILGCRNEGKVFGQGDYVGGIVGLLDTGGQNNRYIGSDYIIGCVNTGSVRASYWLERWNTGDTDTVTEIGYNVGGIVGYLDPYWSNVGTVVRVEDCVNTGKIEGPYNVLGGSRGSAKANLVNPANRRTGLIVGHCNPVYTGTDYNAPCHADVFLLDNLYTSQLRTLWLHNEPTGNADVVSGGNVEMAPTDYDFDYKIGKLVMDANEKIRELSGTISLWNDGADGLPMPVGTDVFNDPDYIPYEQKGTEDDPVIIDSLDDLKTLRTYVNGGRTFDGVNFKITCDIDMNAGITVNPDGTYSGGTPATWVPIGLTQYSVSPSTYFGGRIYGEKPDGSGITIKGMYINSTATSLSGFIGMNKGSVENIAFENCFVGKKRYNAIIAGCNEGSITNCTVKDTCGVKVEYGVAATGIGDDQAPAGGVTAINYGCIKNCINEADVTSDYCRVGGIAGYNANLISYCINRGDICGVASVGGVAGFNGIIDRNAKPFETYAKVEYSGNEGTVTGKGSHIGGTVGWSRNGGGISYSYNAGDVYALATVTNINSYGSGMVSGVLGCGNVNDLGCGTTVIVDTCYNVGNIYRSGNTTTPATTNDVAGWLENYQPRKLKCSVGKNNGNKLHDGVYAEVRGSEYSGYLDLTPANYDPNTDITIQSVFTMIDADNLGITFSEPVKYATSKTPYVALRYCTVDPVTGVPTLKYTESGKPMQSTATLTLDGTSSGFISIVGAVTILAGEQWGEEGEDCAVLLCIEGLEVGDGSDEEYFIDNIVSAQNITNKGNYGLYSSSYTSTVITKAQAANGELCNLISEVIENSPYGQQLGTDAFPTVGNSGIVKKCIYNGNAYKVPADVPNREEGTFIGYVDVNGTLYAPGSSTSSKYVSPEFGFDFSTDYGASVKVTESGETGLRWQAKFDKAQLSKFSGIVSKGFIIVPTAFITGDYAIVGGENVKVKATASDFTAEALKAKALKYIDVKVTGWNDEDETSFAASVVHLFSTHYSLSYSARPYVEVRYSDGSTHYVYGGWDDSTDIALYGGYAGSKQNNARTADTVAERALADLSETYTATYRYAITSASDDYIGAHSDTLAKDHYYSPYSETVRAILFTFIQGDPTITETDKEFYPQYDDAYEFSEMHKKIRRYVYDELQSADGALFSVSYRMEKSLGGNNTSSTSVPFSTISSRWEKSYTSRFEGDDEIISATYTDSASGLQYVTEATIFGDCPTVDFKTTVTNVSAKRSPIINSFKAIDASYKLTQTGGSIVSHTLTGSWCNVDDFQLVTNELSSSVIKFSPQTMQGLSSSHAWPYFDFIGDGCGLLMAIGWSGQWEASLSKTSDGKVNLAAYQQCLNTFLEPGEYLESPRIVLTYFDGDYEYGHNVFRKTMIKHYTPDDDTTDGKQEFTAPISLNFWGGTNNECVIRNVTAFAQAGAKADIVWFDAGWYSPLLFDTTSVAGEYDIYDEANEADRQRFNDYVMYTEEDGNMPYLGRAFNRDKWHLVRGAYTPNSLLFPNGIFEVSDALHDINAQYGTHYKFMVWWMIENCLLEFTATKEGGQSFFYDMRPHLYPFSASDYYTSTDGSKNVKLDEESVYQKLLAYYKDWMDHGLDDIRLDNGIGALNQWRSNDLRATNAKLGTSYNAANSGYYASASYNCRMGYTENKYIHNFYRLWDELKEYNPDFFLDNCASGGRRLDIEMAKRSMPLWRTDYTSSDLEAMQLHTQTLSLWLPLTAHGVAGTGKYQYRSLYSASTCVGGTAGIGSGVAYAKFIDEFVDNRPYWYGNYYQLLEAKYDTSSWQAYELYREDWNEGMVVVIAREYTTETENASSTGKLYKTVKLKGLLSAGKYLVHNIDDAACANDFTATGEELMTKGVQFSSKTKEINCYRLTLVSE